jgi:hypothetical protein
LGHSVDGKGAAYLQKVLEMRISVLVGFSTKRTSLHHQDQHRLKLKVSINIDDIGACGHVSDRGCKELMDGLVGHDRVEEW